MAGARSDGAEVSSGRPVSCSTALPRYGRLRHAAGMPSPARRNPVRCDERQDPALSIAQGTGAGSWHPDAFRSRRSGGDGTGGTPFPISHGACRAKKRTPPPGQNRHFIAGGKPGRPFLGLKGGRDVIRMVAGPDDLGVHDLRHAFAVRAGPHVGDEIVPGSSASIRSVPIDAGGARCIPPRSGRTLACLAHGACPVSGFAARPRETLGRRGRPNSRPARQECLPCTERRGQKRNSRAQTASPGPGKSCHPRKMTRSTGPPCVMILAWGTEASSVCEERMAEPRSTGPAASSSCPCTPARMEAWRRVVTCPRMRSAPRALPRSPRLLSAMTGTEIPENRSPERCSVMGVMRGAGSPVQAAERSQAPEIAGGCTRTRT